MEEQKKENGREQERERKRMTNEIGVGEQVRNLLFSRRPRHKLPETQNKLAIYCARKEVLGVFKVWNCVRARDLCRQKGDRIDSIVFCAGNGKIS